MSDSISSRGFALAGTALAALLLASCGDPTPKSPPAPTKASGFVASAAQVISGAVPGIPESCASPNSEGESFIAVNPTDPGHLVAVWLAGVDFGANTSVAAHSRDGGQSWQRTLIGGTGPCSGGPGDYVIDGWTSIGPDGRAYYLTFAGSDARGESMQVLAAAAVENVWQPAQIIDDNARMTGGIISRTSITADPRVSGRAWALWSRILHPTEGMKVSRTDDGGVTWNAAVTAATLPGGATPAWQLLVGKDGTLVAIYGEADSVATGQELVNGFLGEGAVGSPGIVNRAVRSTNQGQTWSAPSTIVELSAFVIPRAAVGPDGTLLFAWAEVVDGTGKIWLNASSDTGASWTQARLVAEFDAGPLPALDIQQDVAIASDGAIGISYYAGAGDGRIQRRFAGSTDGGATWQTLQLSAPFNYDADNAGHDGGTSDGPLGAYQGLTAMGADFGATFLVETGTADNPTDIMFVRIARGGT